MSQCRKYQSLCKKVCVKIWREGGRGDGFPIIQSKCDLPNQVGSRNLTWMKPLTGKKLGFTGHKQSGLTVYSWTSRFFCSAFSAWRTLSWWRARCPPSSGPRWQKPVKWTRRMLEIWWREASCEASRRPPTGGEVCNLQDLWLNWVVSCSKSWPTWLNWSVWLNSRLTKLKCNWAFVLTYTEERKKREVRLESSQKPHKLSSIRASL